MSETIVVCSKRPPGGRCKLYIAFAEALAEPLNMPVQVVYDGGEGLEPPALMVAGRVIAPADDFMLTPEDIVAGLQGLPLPGQPAGLLARLKAVEDRLSEAAG